MNQFLTNKKDIAAWLKINKVKTYTINDDLSVNIHGDLKINTHTMEYLPVQFGAVSGNVDFDYITTLSNTAKKGKLKSLKGSPQVIAGDFNCRHNDLRNLIGGPQKVGGSYFCEFNKLKSLEGAPETIVNNFNCNNNSLTSLLGGPKKVGDYYYCNSNLLSTLEGIAEVGLGIKASHNKLTSLIGVQTRIEEDFRVSNNRLKSLEGGPTWIGGEYTCESNLLSSLAGFPQFVGNGMSCQHNDGLVKFNLNYAARDGRDYTWEDEGEFLIQTMDEIAVIWEKHQLDSGIVRAPKSNLLNKI